MSINWAIACISFWTVRTTSVFFIQRRLNLLVQQYPIDIFGTWFQIVVTGIVPVAFMNYYPSIILLNKLDMIAYPWLAYTSPLVACALFILASRLWVAGLNHYSSTGS